VPGSDTACGGQAKPGRQPPAAGTGAHQRGPWPGLGYSMAAARVRLHLRQGRALSFDFKAAPAEGASLG